jgi:hypothetical protein
VKVNIGRAFVDGAWYETDTAETLSIAANNDGSGFARIDTIVLRKSYAAQTVRLAVLQGTPAASPAAPTLTQNTSTWEYPLADVAVANLFTTITNANITDRRTAAIQRKVQEGGTSLTAIAAGQIPVGNGTNVMTALAAPSDFAQLFGTSTPASKMAWTGDVRPHKLRGNGGTLTGVNPTLISFAQADWVNPGGLITALASNQFSLAAGTYIVEGFFDYTSDTALTSGFWISNSAAPNTALVISDWQTVSTAVGNTNRQIIPPQLLVSTGSELFEVYGERSAAATYTLATGSTTGMTPTNLTPYGREIWFRKIK